MKRAASTPLGRVLGSGAAHSGTQHWWQQRVTAIALTVLTLWFVISLLCLPDLSWSSVHTWLAKPFSALSMSMLVLAACWHSQLGVSVVIEDYVHGAVSKTLALLLSTFAHLAVAGVALLAVLRIAASGN
ncbi:MAG: succinate dehydrogenase, hydrophobic membrane anchor protein [Nevskiaceae bacterium]|jgi:succinate dehydrogenase / fumarate reductase membrane anchor subunit|nr:succinate dehydrogenase, hydrophobic membrane anchor protein [Nevskiaceae bacterium]